jgi:hypothetical protein
MYVLCTPGSLISSSPEPGRPSLCSCWTGWNSLSPALQEDIPLIRTRLCSLEKEWPLHLPLTTVVAALERGTPHQAEAGLGDGPSLVVPRCHEATLTSELDRASALWTYSRWHI